MGFNMVLDCATILQDKVRVFKIVSCELIKDAIIFFLEIFPKIICDIKTGEGANLGYVI